MINNRYKNRFFVDDVQVYLDYPKSLAKRYERVDKRVFHRESLTSSLIAPRVDFLSIVNADLDHEFDFRIDRWDGTQYETGYVTGKFFKTDCEYDEDRETAKINITATDRYEKILTSIDKEFDLVHDLEPPIHKVNYVKHPLLQIAFEKHGNLINIIGNTTFLLEIPPLLATDLETDYGFSPATEKFAYIPGTNDITPDVSGIYAIDPGVGNGAIYTRSDGEYRVRNIGVDTEDNAEWILENILTDPGTHYTLPFGTQLFEYDSDAWDPSFLGSNTFTATVSGDEIKIFHITPLIRVLTDNDTVDGNATIALPAEGDDIGGHTFGYQYYVDPGATDVNQFAVIPSDGHQGTPTQYGTFDDTALHFPGEYFTEYVVTSPPAWVGLQLYAVDQISWSEYSLWGLKTADMEALLILASTPKTCHHAYELGDVIKYVLAAIDTSVTWVSDVFHSEFLYKTVNPLTGVAYGLTHFVTAKSNILIGDYDNPATRGIITFGDLEQLLLAANLFWWIDKTGHFRVEHIHYFNNGRSYTQQIISNNLTVQLEPKNQKYWAYRTNKYRYKKETLPERIDYSWMDEVSDVFKGHPIEIISQFVQKGNIESVQVARFTSDIDYGQAVPENLSKDGFFIMAATLDGSTYTIQYDDLDVTGVPVNKVQNGFWSFPFLHDKFFRHNLPAEDVKINTVLTTATTTKRAKQQSLVFPSPLEPDAMRLVTTSIDTGEIESLEVNLTTREAKLEVLLPLDFTNPMLT